MPPPTLYRLAYACRLYRDYTGYDASYNQLRTLTNGDLDLDHKAHRMGLLAWLNAWGCRQFAKQYHEMAAKELREWARKYLDRLPSPNVSLVDLADEAVEGMGPVCDALIRKRASVRGYKSGRKAVWFGATGAAKILHALRPKVFVPWDSPIRQHLGYGETGPEYVRYLAHVQDQVRQVIQNAENMVSPHMQSLVQ